MRVYRIIRDTSFQSLAVCSAGQSSAGFYRFDGTPVALEAPAFSATILQPEALSGDLWYVDGGAIALSSGRDEIEGFFEMAGQKLPLQVAGTHLVLLNVLECINNLDRQRTQWREGGGAGAESTIVKYEFHARRFTTSSIFKIPETCETDVLAVERSEEPEDEFKAAVEEIGLKGIAFELLWESN